MIKRKSPWVVSLIVIAILAVSLYSGEITNPKIRSLIENAPLKSDYPDADAIILYSNKNLILQSDGNYVNHFHYLIKSFNYMGKKDYGNFKIQYDEEYEEVIIDTARTINGLAKVDDVDKTGINTITPPWLSRGSIYSNVKEKVISFPSMQDTSIIELVGRIRTIKLPEEPYLGDRDLLELDNPVLEKTITIEVPEGTTLKYFNRNGAPEPTISGNRYTWRINDYKGIVAEPSSPPPFEYLACTYYSTATGWDQIGNFIKDKFNSKIEPDDAIRNKLEEVSSSTNTVETVKDIFLFVADKVRNVDMPLGIAGYTPNQASTVLKRGYGDTRDKCVLLISLIKAAGIDAYPAFVNDAGITIEEGIPFLKQFNKMLVLVSFKDGKKLWLDPFADNCKYGYIPDCMGERALVVYSDGARFEQVESYINVQNSANIKYDLTLEPGGGLSGDVKVFVDGYFDYALRYSIKDARPKQVEMEIEKAANTVASGAKLLDKTVSDMKDLTEPAVLHFSFEADKCASIQQDMVIFYVPIKPFEFTGLEFPVSSEGREFPILLPTAFEKKGEYEINVPADFNIEYTPENAQLENPLGSFSVTSEVKDGKIYYSYSIKVNKRHIAAGEYESFKGLVQGFLSPKNNLVLLEIKK
ncbi:DUF3857 domain-containing protein [bacterium]|nr:DUF3857 domain-containing protein [bacterium]